MQESSVAFSFVPLASVKTEKSKITKCLFMMMAKGESIEEILQSSHCLFRVISDNSLLTCTDLHSLMSSNAHRLSNHVNIFELMCHHRSQLSFQIMLSKGDE